MAIQRSKACCLLLALLLSLQLTSGLPFPRRKTSVPAAGAGDITVYWGRNKDEGSLREACDTGLYKTVIISFLSAFGHGQYKLDLTGHPDPPYYIGNDIKYCKSKGIVVLLAIGGQGGEYWLPSSQAATQVADYLWNAYLGGSRAGVVRPFGNAVVDGIDFFIDQGAKEHYDELARLLRRRGVSILTASPRCGYPDHRLEAALDTWLFDRIHVRLYGEDRNCFRTPVESWKKWAAAYPRSKVFVGVEASQEAYRDTYIPPWDLYYRVLLSAKTAPNYGGVVIWNRFLDKKTGYTQTLKRFY